MAENIMPENTTLPGVGIDLGTTNSVIAFANRKPNGTLVSKVVEIPRAVEHYTSGGSSKFTLSKRTLLPSCVYYQMDHNYEPLVGDFAKGQYAIRPQLVAKSIKSQMGAEFAIGLANEVRDKTPEAISSRILAHLIKNTEKSYHASIQEAIVTVPANFDSAMCNATVKAAQLAGLDVGEQGREKPVLLSEPNAVIYDLINQINNGEVPDTVINLSHPKQMLVFDLGGGTLDITMHKIQYRDDKQDTVKVDEIATNRYTRLGGDDFDKAIAETMFQRYLEKNASYGRSIKEKLLSEKNNVMPQFLVYAENVKIELSTSKDSSMQSDSLWNDEDEESIFTTGGNLGNGYAYDDAFSQEDIEKILMPFMGKSLVFEDYKRLEQLTERNNIIYPILDVLKKAASKLGTADVKVDGVILNGGMSRFYMVADRLRDFFGLEPIVITNPDQAVARGAAIYHYYLRQNQTLASDMIHTRLDEAGDVQPRQGLGIEWGKKVLNESLYLGLQNGAAIELIAAGAELPFVSKKMTGFTIDSGMHRICIPIQTKDANENLSIIAKGNIALDRVYSETSYVAFVVSLSESKLLTMDVVTSRDPEGKNALSNVKVELAIGHSSTDSKSIIKIAPPSRTPLNAQNEVQNLLNLCEKYQARLGREAAEKVRECLVRIRSCPNKKDFADPLIRELGKAYHDETKMRLLTLARKLGSTWSPEEQRKMANICLDLLKSELAGLEQRGARVSANIAAILALGFFGKTDQVEKLKGLSNKKYTQAQMYVFGKRAINLEWVYTKFVDDFRCVGSGLKGGLQFSAYAIATALRGDLHPDVEFPQAENVVDMLCKCLEKKKISETDLQVVILSLGWICDQRSKNRFVSQEMVEKVTETLDARYNRASLTEKAHINHCSDIATKMMTGLNLTEEDNAYLLKFDERFAN